MDRILGKLTWPEEEKTKQSVTFPWYEHIGNFDDIYPKNIYLAQLKKRLNIDNILPDIQITSPVTNSVVTANNLIVTAMANDRDGSITNTELFLDGVLISADSEAPFSWSIPVSENKSYNITVVASDDQGATSSHDITFTTDNVLTENGETIVPTDYNTGVSCAIVPFVNINNMGLNSRSIVTVEIGDNIEFAPESSQFGATSSGWSYTGPNGFTHSGRSLTINNIQLNNAGTYTVTNIDENACTSTYNIIIDINTPPTLGFVTPTNGAVLFDGDDLEVAINATDADGTIAQVELFLNGIPLRTDDTSPYNWNVSGQVDSELQNLAVGNYMLKAVATDNDGATVEVTIDFTVREQMISFQQPLANTRIPEGDNLTVTVDVIDTSVTIVRVDLYLDNVLVRSDTEAPYQWGGPEDSVLQNMLEGYYTLEAVATTNNSIEAEITRAFKVGEGPSEIEINVQGNGYIKKNFEDNELLWSNRTYPIQDLPFDFIGFEFLQNSASIAEGGTITPLADGYIYIIAKESEGPSKLGDNWTVVPNSRFNYNDKGNPTPLVIFQHVAIANTAIQIPLATGFTGLTPIAKTIQLNTLGIDDYIFENSTSFIVYPNPAKEGLITVQLKGIGKAEVSIFNLYGRLLYKKKDVKGILNIHTLNKYSPGLYLIKVITDKDEVLTKKIIIN